MLLTDLFLFHSGQRNVHSFLKQTKGPAVPAGLQGTEFLQDTGLPGSSGEDRCPMWLVGKEREAIVWTQEWLSTPEYSFSIEALVQEPRSRKELTMADSMLEIKNRGKHITSKALDKRHENEGSLGMEKISLFIHIDSQRGLLLRIWVKLLPVFAATRV